MSAASNATVERTARRPWGPCGGNHERRGNWSAFNTASMIFGFVFFWPVGMALLFWILSGRDVRDLPQAVRHQWERVSGSWNGGTPPRSRSDNVVFDDYQRTQYDRIREIKEEIAERARRFEEFRASARRRADEEEFNRFMADAPPRGDG